MTTTTEYKIVLPIMCSECGYITAFDVPRKNAIGATYDCNCGRVMLIKGNLRTVDLHADMSKRLHEQYGIDVQKADWAHIELDGES
jgi:hypothetical protein